MVLKEYLSLPFCYMSFVIKDLLEKDKKLSVGNTFDLVPYNYVYNRSTAFLDSDFVFRDHQKLEAILENFYQLDAQLLEILHYIQIVPVRLEQSFCDSFTNFICRRKYKKPKLKNTALHLALRR